MTTDTLIETVGFRCPQCAHEWLATYDVVHSSAPSGYSIENFRLHGLPVMPPYSWSGAPRCAVCGNLVIGRLRERRSLAQGGVASPPSRECGAA